MEGRFNSLKQEMDLIKKSSAKISRVNLNASSIRKVERQVGDLEGSLQKKLELLEQKLSAGQLEKVEQLVTRVDKLTALLNGLDQKQKLLESNLQEADRQLALFRASEKKLADHYKEFQDSQKEQKSLIQNYDSFRTAIEKKQGDSSAGSI